MADSSGISQANSERESSMDDDEEADRRRHDHLTSVMDRLRMKAGHRRCLLEVSKTVKIRPSEKRPSTEGSEKNVLHYLHTLQKAFKVNSLASMLERLESIAHRVGIRFAQTHPDGSTVVLSTDMFYVEIMLDTVGTVIDVRITQGVNTVSCAEVASALREGDNDLFISHLKGLSSIYQINGDKKQRSKCFLAIDALDTDLFRLSKLQSSFSSVANYIHKTPLGIVQPRAGGLPMRLTYFVGPYDLLDSKTRSSTPMTVDAINEKQLGHSLTVSIEASSTHKLPIMPLMTVNKTPDGKSLPSFTAVSSLNSCSLPAVYVLRLQQPVAMALSIIKRIQAITGLDFVDAGRVKPLLTLLSQQAADKGSKDVGGSAGYPVTLPDQHHNYYFTGVNGCAHLHAAIVTVIPFLHPTSVPQIVACLRQQVALNTLLGSCMRRVSADQQVSRKALTFEVCPLSLQHIAVTFEHPLREDIATAEFDISDITAATCKLYTAGGSENTSENSVDDFCTDEFMTQVLQRSLSIPITLRAIFQRARTRLSCQQGVLSALDAVGRTRSPIDVSPTLSRVGQQRRAAFVASGGSSGGGAACDLGSLHLMSGGSVCEMGTGSLTGIDPSVTPSAEMLRAINADKISKNPMLASLLDQETSSPGGGAAGANVGSGQQGAPSASMLSALLDDGRSTSGSRKLRKRRSGGGNSPGRSPKHSRDGEAYCVTEAPLAPVMPPPPPTAAVVPPGGSIAYPHESHVNRLASTLDSIIAHESRNLPNCQHSELANILNDHDTGGKSTVKLSDDSPRSACTPTAAGDFDDRFQGGGSGGGGIGGVGPQMNGCTSLPSASEEPVQTPELDEEEEKVQDLATPTIANPFDFGSSVSHQVVPLVNSTDVVACDRVAFRDTSPTTTTVVAKLPRSNSSSNCSSASSSIATKPRTDKVDDKNFVASGSSGSKERRKEKRSSDSRSAKPYITMKVNTKELTTKMIVKEPVVATSTPTSSSVPPSSSSSSSAAIPSPHTDGERRQKVRKLTSEGATELVSNGIAAGERVKTDRRRRTSSKHDGGGDTKKRKRNEESRRSNSEHLSRKHRIYDFEGESTDGATYEVIAKATPKIKISTAGGRIHVQTSSKSAAVTTAMPITTTTVTSSSSITVSTAGKTSPALTSPKASKNHADRALPSGHKGAPRSYCRSRSEGVQSSGGSKVDTKLQKTPTIKLKPISVPHTSSSSSSSGTTSTVSSVSHASTTKPKAPTRKNSLSAVIDKLTKQQAFSTPLSTGGANSASSEKPPATLTKENADAIRLRILSEGNKPTTPPKEAGTKTVKAVPATCKLACDAKLTKPLATVPKVSSPRMPGVRVPPGSGLGRGRAEGKHDAGDKDPPPRGGCSGSNGHRKPRQDDVESQQSRHFLDVVARFDSPVRDGATPPDASDKKTARSATSPHVNELRTDVGSSKRLPDTKPLDLKTKDVMTTPRPSSSSSLSSSAAVTANDSVKTSCAISSSSSSVVTKLSDSITTRSPRLPDPRVKPDTAATAPTTATREEELNPLATNSENKENAAVLVVVESNKDSGVFKAPSAKPSPAPTPTAWSKVASPHSDVASSPEDGLVIDCPSTPGRLSPVRKIAKLVASPASPPVAKSPMSQRNVTSPCEIDDDLMDMAVARFNSLSPN